MVRVFYPMKYPGEGSFDALSERTRRRMGCEMISNRDFERAFDNNLLYSR